MRHRPATPRPHRPGPTKVLASSLPPPRTNGPDRGPRPCIHPSQSRRVNGAPDTMSGIQRFCVRALGGGAHWDHAMNEHCTRHAGSGGRARRRRLRRRAAGPHRPHFDRYVDDGRLPGWLVARHARRAGRPPDVVRPARRRGRAAGRARHAVAHLLDDQADHVGGGDDALRGGRLRAEGPGQPRSSRRSRTCACTAAARPAAR